mgnify:CR=1 FL=1
MKLNKEEFEKIKYYVTHDSGLNSNDLNNLIDTVEAQHDEIESLRNWNACEAELYDKLLKSDLKRIQYENLLEESVETIENCYGRETEMTERIRNLIEEEL